MRLPVGGGQKDLAPSLTEPEYVRQTLGMAQEERQQKLTQTQQLQLFREQADHVENWLAAKEAFLNNDDLGVSHI
jgi:spectrin beta